MQAKKVLTRDAGPKPHVHSVVKPRALHEHRRAKKVVKLKLKSEMSEIRTE